MTEVVVDSADQQSSNNTATQPVIGGAGRLLRQAREQQQMSVQALASTLKVPVYKLQALEEDRWDVLDGLCVYPLFGVECVPFCCTFPQSLYSLVCPSTRQPSWHPIQKALTRLLKKRPCAL